LSDVYHVHPPAVLLCPHSLSITCPSLGTLTTHPGTDLVTFLRMAGYLLTCDCDARATCNVTYDVWQIYIHTHARHTHKHSHTSLQHQSSPLLAVPLSPPPPPLPIPLHPLPLCLQPPRPHLLSPFPMIPSPNSEPVTPTHIP
jgi:hypothetical protein